MRGVKKVLQMTFSLNYSKCFKTSNTSCLKKRPRQTVQTQIRLLLKKQSDQGFPVCQSDKYFVNSSPDNPHFFVNTESEKCSKS